MTYIAPITHVIKNLPFDRDDVDWEWFEAAARDLLDRTELPGIVGYGVRGSAQDGIDAVATIDGFEHGVQFKQVKHFYKRDVEGAMAAAVYPATKFVLVLASRAGVSARKAIKTDEKWRLIDQESLSALVRKLPRDEAAQYITRWFGPQFVEPFLGIPRATSFVSRDVFFSPDTMAVIDHVRARVGPTEPLETTVGAIAEGSPVRAVIVSGPIGMGKSKLLFDATAQQTELPTLFLARGMHVTGEGLRELPARAVVVVDDANDVEQIDALIQHVVRNPELKLIIATAANDRERLRDAFLAAGVTAAQTQEILAERLGADATIALIQAVLGREDPHVEESIIRYASDTPLNTILMARVVREQHAGGDAIGSQEQARELIRALYRDVAAGDVSSDAPPDDVRRLLAVLALTTPAHIEDDAWVNAAAEALEWSADYVGEVLDAIELSGILEKRGRLYALAPAVLRESIAADAVVRRGRITDLLMRVYAAFGPDGSLLRNVAIADLQLAGPDNPRVFDALWERVRTEILAMNSFDRLEVVEKLDEVSYFKPRELSAFILELITSPAANEETQPYYGSRLQIHHGSVAREALKHFAITMALAPETVDTSVRTLWARGRHLERQTGISSDDPIGTIIRVARYEAGAAASAREIVRTVRAMIAEGIEDTQQHSLIELVAPILSREFTPTLDRRTKLMVTRAVVDVTRVRDLRDDAIELVCAAATGPEERRATSALDQLVDLLRSPSHFIGQPTQEQVGAWDRERVMVLDAFDAVANHGFPMRELSLIISLPWFAVNSDSQFVRDRTRVLLERLQPSADRDLFRSLIPKFNNIMTFRDVSYSDWHVEASKDRNTLIDGSARSLIRECEGDETRLLQRIDNAMTLTVAAGYAPSCEDLIGAIFYAEREIGERLVTLILQRNEERYVGALMYVVRARLREDPNEAEAFANELIDHGDASASAVARALDQLALNAPSGRDVGERLFRRLLAHPNEVVRGAAAWSATFFIRSHPELAVPLVLSATLDDSRTTEHLFMILSTVRVLAEDADAVTRKLNDVSHLEYWTLTFLARVAEVNPGLVIEFFFRRIAAAEDNPSIEPLPSFEKTIHTVFDALTKAPSFAGDLPALLERIEAVRTAAGGLRLASEVARIAPSVIKARALAALRDRDEARASFWLRRIPYEQLAEDVPYLADIANAAADAGEHATNRIEVALYEGLRRHGEFVAITGRSDSEDRIQAATTAALQLELVPLARRIFERLRDRSNLSQRQMADYFDEHVGLE